MEKKEQTGLFNISSIVLVDCSFKRESIINFDDPAETKADIKIECNQIDNVILVSLELIFIQESKGKPEITSSIRMVGSFETIGELTIPFERLGRVNGAAIIFPFVREQLANLCMKASVPTVLLPPANFQAMYDNYLASKEKSQEASK